MFSFQISGLEEDINDLEEKYFAEHANFFPLTGTLCIQKQMRQLYFGGRLGGGGRRNREQEGYRMWGRKGREIPLSPHYDNN